MRPSGFRNGSPWEGLSVRPPVCPSVYPYVHFSTYMKYEYEIQVVTYLKMFKGFSTQPHPKRGMLATWNLTCRAYRWIYFWLTRRFLKCCLQPEIKGGQAILAGLPQLPPRSWGRGIISKIASLAQNIFTFWPCISNFKFLSCSVRAVGGGRYKKRYIIFNNVAICIWLWTWNWLPDFSVLYNWILV